MAGDESALVHKSNSPPAISKLYTDVLWRIFSMNANMDLENTSQCMTDEEVKNCRAMNITRYSSQVCRRWRDIILGSTSLWGRIIDLSLLQQPSANWKEEVLKRTGRAHLYVRGTASGLSISGPFFISLLKDHWGRIRSLKVNLLYATHFTGEMWTSLTRPNPVIQVFELRVDKRIPETPTMPPWMTWYSQIRGLHISYPYNSQTSVTRIFEVLSAMPLLESLTLGSGIPTVPYNTISTLPAIILPRLSELSTVRHQMDLSTCIAILANIQPRPGCLISLYCRDFDLRIRKSLPISEHDANLVRSTLASCLDAHFSHQPTAGLSLEIEQAGFTFENFVPTTYLSSFRFEVFSSHISLLLDVLATCRYSEVTTLDFHGDLTDEELQTSMIKVLQSCPSIKTLTTSAANVESFTSIPGGIYLFPSLRILEVTGYFKFETAVALVSFLRQRKDAGFPRAMIDLKECNFMGDSWDRFCEQYEDALGDTIGIVFLDGEESVGVAIGQI